MVARSMEKLVSRQREQVARVGGAVCYTYCSSSSGRSRFWAARRTAVHCESEADADARGRWPEGARGAGSAPPWPVDDDRDDDECCPLGRIDLRPWGRSVVAGVVSQRLLHPKQRCWSSCCLARCCWSRPRLKYDTQIGIKHFPISLTFLLHCHARESARPFFFFTVPWYNNAVASGTLRCGYWILACNLTATFLPGSRVACNFQPRVSITVVTRARATNIVRCSRWCFQPNDLG